MIERIKRRLKRTPAAKASPRANFHDQYQQAEARRNALVARLNGLNEEARAHPSYKHALTLLNQHFRKAKLAQRAAVLQAAEWMINVLETLTLMV